MKKGIDMLVDGHDADVVRAVMEKDIELTSERHATAIKVFRSLGDLGPAMGMIGTLVGLVAMLANMSDPKSIGPAMAVALLTTLYGAIEANMIAIPIADKLELRSGEEQLSRTLILDAIMGIRGWTEPEGDPSHVAELPESVQTQQRDRIGAHRWQSASARLPDCPVTWEPSRISCLC